MNPRSASGTWLVLKKPVIIDDNPGTTNPLGVDFPGVNGPVDRFSANPLEIGRFEDAQKFHEFSRSADDLFMERFHANVGS